MNRITTYDIGRAMRDAHDREAALVDALENVCATAEIIATSMAREGNSGAERSLGNALLSAIEASRAVAYAGEP